MMKVCFYSNARKPDGREIKTQWVRIVFDENETSDSVDGCFYEDKRLIYGCKVFAEYGNMVDARCDIEIAGLVEKYRPEVVLLASHDTYLEAVKNSEKEEMEPKLTVNDRRDMIHYSIVGSDGCALIVAVE